MGFSDLRSNVIRGVLAEFLVAKAVGAEQRVRDAWDNYDVRTPDGTRIEVKSSAYLQSWTQKRLSRLVFGQLFGLAFDATTNEYGSDRKVRADVFVFCVHTEQDPAAYQVLDISKWTFYVVSADRVRASGARTVGIAWVEAQAGAPARFDELAPAIAACR